MNGKTLLLFMAVFLQTIIVSTVSAEADLKRCSSPFIDLKVEIDPVNHYITGRAKWLNLPAMARRMFYLNKLFKINSLKVDGDTVEYVFDVGELTVLEQGREIEIVYSGCVADTMADVNLISSKLVELALYSGYYPLNLNDIPLFEYRLELTLPADF